MSKDTGSYTGYVIFRGDFEAEEYAATRAAANNIKAQTKDMNTAFGMFFILFGLAGEFLFVGKVNETKQEEQLLDDIYEIRMRGVAYGGTKKENNVPLMVHGGYSAAAKTAPSVTATREIQYKASSPISVQPEDSSANHGQTHHEKQTALCKTRKIVTFGHYPQNTTDKDPVEWLVLDYDAVSKRTLLISRYALDCEPYNGSAENVTWETSAVRKWLNTAFLNEAFNADEQREILSANVNNGQDQGFTEYDTSGGNDTEDKVFLLSYAETMKYFGNSKDCMCVPTPHAIGHGAYVSSENMLNGKAACWWWLRSPGSSASSASIVGSNGKCYSRVATYNSFTVRPAFWLDLPDN